MRPFLLFPSFDLKISGSNTQKLYLSYCFLILFTTITSLIISLSLFSSASEKTSPYFLLLENWNQPFLSDIKITTQEYCPDGYFKLFNYHWPGTMNGCYCRDAMWLPENRHGISTILDTGFCTINQTRAGCVDIRSIPGKDLSRWKNFKLLCGKRMEGTSFTLNFPQYPGDCPKDSLKCGGDNIDSSFCIPAKFKVCPINSIIAGRNKPGDEYNESVAIDEEGNLSLYWTREPLKMPISEFRISEEAVCLKNHDVKLAFDRSEYKLEISSKSRCQETDPRFVEIDDLSERQFFYYNQLNYLEDVLPDFHFSNNIYWKIFSRSYINFRFECRHMVSKLQSNYQKVESVKEANEKWINFICIFELISLCFNIVYAILCLKNAQNTLWLQIITAIINFIARYCCLKYAREIMSSTEVFKNLLNNLGIFECSDDITNSYFKMLRDDDVGMSVGALDNLNAFLIALDVLILFGSICFVKMNKNGIKLQ